MSAGVVVGVCHGMTALVGIGVLLAGWLVRNELRQRRKSRYLAQLSAHRKQPRALPAGEEPQPPREELPRLRVTVDELVTRIEREGQPVRLQWGDKNGGGSDAGQDEWPTGVLPRTNNTWSA